ncbi:MAG: hypothetical protein B6U78_03005 [Candidatus Aenigmarchaeota archaeon ex4484_224]|nr:MAG: hypothetical protein B6U78_03005 [Candidatus Aenigmarchaeota archaeon ex4484_224]
MIETLELVVKLSFISDILGTAPSPELLKRDFFKTIGKKALKDAKKLEEETEGLSTEAYTKEDYKVSKSSEEEKNNEITQITYFRKDNKGIYLPNFMVKGFLKAAAQALKEQINLPNPRAKIDRYVFIFPNKIYLYRNGNILKKHKDEYIRPIRAMTPKGERTSLVSSERIEASEDNPVITDEIRIVLIKNKEIDLKKLKKMLEYGFYSGISQFRSAGFGREKEEVESKSENGKNENNNEVKKKKIKVKKANEK